MGTKVLFDFVKEKHSMRQTEKKKLEEYPIIRCAPGEKILCVQRQHPITLISQMVLPILVAFFILLALGFVPLFFPQLFPNIFYNSTVIVSIMLIIISALFVVETFTFMTWYYQFYIITNKAIVHRHCFRIAGAYSEVVFDENMHVQDIVRNPPNLLYDFLKIQDVSVYFHRLEREEPFIFKTPENAQVIEDIIQDSVTQANPKGKT